MIFDTHSHCYWADLKSKIPDILAEMQEKNVVFATQIGCDIDSSREALELALNFPNHFFATIGYHPECAQNDASWRTDLRDFFEKYSGQDFYKNDTEKAKISQKFFTKKKEEFSHIFQNPDASSKNFEKFLEFLNSLDSEIFEKIFKKLPIFVEFEKMILENRTKIVAIGECGLDFHYIDGTDDGKIPADLENLSDRARWQIENQKFWWLVQWKFAEKYDLPIVIHSRDAGHATPDFMKKFSIKRAVMHSYAENPEIAQKLLDFSDEIYFSFSGIVTYKKATQIQETAKIVPLDRIMVETDSPFLSPEPFRGKSNNPSRTFYVLEKIFSLRDKENEEIEKQIFENSLRFYNIDKLSKK